MADYEVENYTDKGHTETPQVDLKVGLSWEIDLWGNIRWSTRKASAEYLASVEAARAILRKGSEIGQMMKVVGEEGTSLGDFTTYLKAEFLDAVYLQQNAFSEADASTSVERQKIMFDVLEKVLLGDFEFPEKDATRKFFLDLQQAFIDWNDKPFESEEFSMAKAALEKKISEATDGIL
jgi:V/A-type H+-transporting ATPase subunit A